MPEITSNPLAHFASMPTSLPGLSLLILGKISEPTLFKPLSLSPAHCVFSPGSCRANSNPLVFRVSFGFIIAREDYPVIAPRVTFLRERFWANGVESDRTVENPEPFLASLPSLRAVSSESEPLQSSSSCFKGHFSDLLNGLGLCACLSLFQICAKGLFIF
jgi:hypothetical protein